MHKPVLVHDIRHSKARYVPAMPGIPMLAMAENHITTNSMGLQCLVQIVL